MKSNNFAAGTLQA